MEHVKAAIRDVEGFPKPGIVFKDITPILKDPRLFRDVIAALSDYYRSQRIDKIAAMESRGFIFAAPLAAALDVGFIPLRKFGKLPHDTVSESFDLEYGSETLEIHRDAIQPGERVLIVDDLLATGGTAVASVKLVKKVGGEVAGLAFVVELSFLKGRERLNGMPVHALITFS